MRHAHSRLALACLAAGIAFISADHLFRFQLFEGVLANHSRPAADVFRDDQIAWAALVSQFAFGTFFTLCCATLSSVTRITEGTILGFGVGLLLGTGFGLHLYGLTHFFTLPETLIDAILFAVNGAVAGGVATWILNRRSERASGAHR